MDETVDSKINRCSQELSGVLSISQTTKRTNNSKDDEETPTKQLRIHSRIVNFRSSNNEIIQGIISNEYDSHDRIWVRYNNGTKKISMPLTMLAMENPDDEELKQYLPESQESLISSQSSVRNLFNQIEQSRTLPMIDEEATERKQIKGKDVYDFHEFHYVKDNLGKKRLIIITDFKNDRCYAFGPFQTFMRCLGCKIKEVSCRADFSDDMKQVYMQTSHVCETERIYSEEMNSLLDPQLIAGKPFDPEKFGLAKYPESRIEHRSFYIDKKLLKKLILFVDELVQEEGDTNASLADNRKCYEFTWYQNVKLYKCVGCESSKSRRRSLHAWTKRDDEGEIAYTKNGHTCEPRVYSEVIASLKRREKEKELVSPDDFEIVEHLNEKGELSTHLIIKAKGDPKKDNEKKCYIYCKSQEKFNCLGCRKDGHSSATLCNIDGILHVIAGTKHCCEPRDYEKEMGKLQKNVPEDLSLCEIKTVTHNKKEIKVIHVYADEEKRLGYKFGPNGKNNYRCRGCGKNAYTSVNVNESKGEIKSVVRNREHVCKPILLSLPQLPTTGEFKRFSWSIKSEGVEALKWLKSIFMKFGRGSCSMCAAYFLSTAPPTEHHEVILSNKFYNGFSSVWIQRAWHHYSNGKWTELLKMFDTIWMYPILIDESAVCEEMEALGIALFQAGSLPELSIQNTRRESFKLFDDERGIYILEEIATNPTHDEHAKLVLA